MGILNQLEYWSSNLSLTGTHCDTRSHLDVQQMGDKNPTRSSVKTETDLNN